VNEIIKWGDKAMVSSSEGSGEGRCGLVLAVFTVTTDVVASSGDRLLLLAAPHLGRERVYV